MDTATEKAIEQKVDSNFIRIHPDKEEFIFLELSIKYLDTSNNHWKKTKINKISTRLLGLELKSENKIKSKAMKLVVNKTLPDYKKHCPIFLNIKTIIMCCISCKKILRTKIQVPKK